MKDENAWRAALIKMTRENFVLFTSIQELQDFCDNEQINWMPIANKESGESHLESYAMSEGYDYLMKITGTPLTSRT